MTVITELPTPPSRNSPSTFSERADAFLGTLPTFVTEANALAAEVSADAATVDASAVTAAEKAAEAAASATQATAAANVTKWVSGTAYAQGAMVWSPSNYQTYRRKTNGSGTIDPSSDTTNWERITNSRITREERTADTSLVFADCGKLIDITSGTFTQTIAPASSLGNGWFCYVKNTGEGPVTIDPNGSETVDGALTFPLYSGATVLLQCNGESFSTIRPGLSLVRLPILSAATVGLEASSVLEDITGDLYATGLGSSGNVNVIYDHGEDLFIAYSSAASANIATSPDGETWTLRAMPSSSIWVVVPGPGGWFAYVYNGTYTAFSSNAGVSWTPKTALAFNGYRAATLGDRILICQLGTTTAAYSDDYGATWTPSTLPASANEMYGVGSVFFLRSSTSCYTSTTGATGSWVLGAYPFSSSTPVYLSQSINGLVSGYNNSQNTFYTTDGLNWTEIPDSSDVNLMNVAGVWVWFDEGDVGRCRTYHNGKAVMRRCSISTTGLSIGGYDGDSLHVMGVSAPTGLWGYVMVINETTYNKTGLFEV